MRIEIKKSKNGVGYRDYAGLFLVTLSTLMYEILLTRIFSVTMWYHFAFVAISIAMFGMTVGAVLVYIFPRRFAPEWVHRHLALCALLFSLTMVGSFLVHLAVPFGTRGSILLTYVVITVPFVFSGICVCLALTRFPKEVSRLYAADLAGAALGCILLKFLLDLTDGPTAVFAVAAMAGAGAFLYACAPRTGRLRTAAAATVLLLGLFAVWHTSLSRRQAPILRLAWAKGVEEPVPIYEKWNSFSRVSVYGTPDVRVLPLGWALSETLMSQDFLTAQLMLVIDSGASTILTGFDGDLTKLEYLKYDLVNLAHFLRADARVLVVGAGGGRDVLTALVFNQRSVLGVEINENILDTVNRVYGDFTGHLDQNLKVRFVNDEARSFISRQVEKYDILQISLIDTWAATVAGAFVLSENTLYTVEAWRTFLSHLAPRGILTVSRWYFRDRPGEMYRVVSLAVAALKAEGVANPRDHIIIARKMYRDETGVAPDGIGTILVCRDPFSAEDVSILGRVANRMRFEIMLSPAFSADPAFTAMTSGGDAAAFYRSFPLNVSAPTDDSPFFFHMLRLGDIFKGEAILNQGAVTFNLKAVYVLGMVLIEVVALTLLCIMVPLALTGDRTVIRGAFPLFLYFASIGLGFILVEVSQMERLIIFLGHPSYSLSVVLFTLLLSSGLGSFLTQGIAGGGSSSPGLRRLALLLGALVLFGMLTPFATNIFRSATTPVRILVAAGILFPLGLFMGMAFPLGMKAASGREDRLLPWLWGINGATSVNGSVFSVVIAMNAGIAASFWTGVACYLAATGAYFWAMKGGR